MGAADLPPELRSNVELQPARLNLYGVSAEYLPERARALRQMLATQPGVVTPEQLARKFMRARVERVEELLQTLVSLGQAREVETGRFAA